MAVGNIFRLVLEAEQSLQLVENVFWYQQGTAFAGNAAQALVDAFQLQVLTPLSVAQVNSMVYTRIVAHNVNNLAENFEDLTATPANGVYVTASMPVFCAVNLRSSRPDLSKRYSYKRFGGVPRDSVSGNFVAGQGLTDWQNVANALEAVLSPGFGSFSPVQIKVGKDGAGNPTYAVNYTITEWILQTPISTQNTRKIGRGD